MQAWWRRVQARRAEEARRLYFVLPDPVRDIMGSTAIELVRRVRSKAAFRFMRADIKKKWHEVCGRWMAEGVQYKGRGLAAMWPQSSSSGINPTD